MIVLLCAAASAADLAGFAGTWGLDPSRSDDPSEAIAAALVRPAASAGAASAYSPDGNGDASDDPAEQREKLVREVLGLLAVSGTIGLAPTDGGVTLTFGGEDTLVLSPGDGWSKLKRDGGTWKVRVREQGDRLAIERRYKSTAVVETLIPPEDRELVVVVRVDGSGIDPGVEFRRVYRALGPAPAQ